MGLLVIRRLPAFRNLASFSLARSMSAVAPLLLSPQEAAKLPKSGTSRAAFLDATWFMPGSPRNAKNEFLSRRLPGSQFLDLDQVASSHELGLKHMMPDGQTFAKACEDLGISSDDHVIIYDSHGVFSSPRALFMFRTFGHDNSSIINGGLPKWIDEGLTLDSVTASSPNRGQYSVPTLNENAIKNYDEILANSVHSPVDNEAIDIVLDARSSARFNGTVPEPRPGLSSGHMPHSFSLPFNSFLEQAKTSEGTEYTQFRAAADIEAELVRAIGPAETKNIIQGSRSVITTCGSGMTAGVLWLGLKLLRAKDVAIYDESWTGYAMRPSSKIEKA